MVIDNLVAVLICLGCALIGYGLGYNKGSSDAHDENRRIAEALWDEQEGV